MGGEVRGEHLAGRPPVLRPAQAADELLAVEGVGHRPPGVEAVERRRVVFSATRRVVASGRAQPPRVLDGEPLELGRRDPLEQGRVEASLLDVRQRLASSASTVRRISSG